MTKQPLPVVSSACYAKLLVSNQQIFIAEQNAKAPVHFKLSALLKSGKQARREMYQHYYQNQYK